MSSVDVIVPCYRYGHFLRECVESVLADAAVDVRVLILDDASPDNTAEIGTQIAQEDSRVTFHRHVTNKGHIATYNEGIEWVSADYMVLLSADDYLLPGALGRAARLMDAHPEVGLTFGKCLKRAAHETATPPIPATRDAGWRVLSGPEFITLSGPRNIVPTPTALVRTAVQKHVGGYRPELPHSGDLEMWLRFAAHTSVGILDAYQAVYRLHGQNMSIGYRANGFLLDLHQRESALASFFQHCSHLLPNASHLHRQLRTALGRDAIGHASTAFNHGDMEIVEQLSDFALRVSPDIGRSWPWVKLRCKQSIGMRTWQGVQQPLAGLRRTAAALAHLSKAVLGRMGPSQSL